MRSCLGIFYIRMAIISIAPFPVPLLFPYIRLPIYRASIDVIRFDMCCIYELPFLARAGGRSCDNEIIEGKRKLATRKGD